MQCCECKCIRKLDNFYSYRNIMILVAYIFLFCLVFLLIHFWLFFQAFEVQVLAKLDMILEQQTEQTNLLQQLASGNTTNGPVELFEDLLPQRLKTCEDLDEFNHRLENLEYIGTKR